MWKRSKQIKVGDFVRYSGSDTDFHGVYEVKYVPVGDRGYVLESRGIRLSDVHVNSIELTDEFVGEYSNS